MTVGEAIFKDTYELETDIENVPGITEEMDSIDDDRINMRDLAKAGLLWMDEQLWP